MTVEPLTNRFLSLSSAWLCRMVCIFAAPKGGGVVFPRYRDHHVRGIAPLTLPLRMLLWYQLVDLRQINPHGSF